jgi:hypothetical protein
MCRITFILVYISLHITYYCESQILLSVRYTVDLKNIET